MHSFTSKASRDVRCNWKLAFQGDPGLVAFPSLPPSSSGPPSLLISLLKTLLPTVSCSPPICILTPHTSPTLLFIHRHFFLHLVISSLLTSFRIALCTLHHSTPPRHYLRPTFPRLSLLRIINLSLLCRCV